MKKFYLLFSTLGMFLLNVKGQDTLGASWLLNGNSGTSTRTNFLGTIDNEDLIIKTNNSERIRVLSTGAVGINKIPNSNVSLDVSGPSKLYGNGTYQDVLDIYNDLADINSQSDLLFLRYGQYQPNIPSVMSVAGMTTPTKYEVFFNLRSNGKLGLGTYNFQTCSDCADYRLFVKDGIKTEKVKVDIAAENGWADYVFDKDYKLMPLNDVKNFIQKNGHLPEVPTTEEAIKNGIELKEMNILLLKKIEELTLHIIELDKRIEKLEKLNN